MEQAFVEDAEPGIVSGDPEPQDVYDGLNPMEDRNGRLGWGLYLCLLDEMP